MSDFAEWEATEWRARQGAADAANDEGEMREITIRKRSRVAKAAVEASRIVARGVARWMKAAGLSKWTGAVRGDREAESEEEEEDTP